MVRTRVVDKKKAPGDTGGKKNGDDLLDQEVHKAIQRELALLKKQLTLEVSLLLLFQMIRCYDTLHVYFHSLCMFEGDTCAID